jgi:hypothetical protein
MNEAAPLTLAFAPGICRDHAESLKMLRPNFCRHAGVQILSHEFRRSLSTAAAKHSNDDALVPSFAATNEPRSAAEIEIKVNDAFLCAGC